MRRQGLTVRKISHDDHEHGKSTEEKAKVSVDNHSRSDTCQPAKRQKLGHTESTNNTVNVTAPTHCHLNKRRGIVFGTVEREFTPAALSVFSSAREVSASYVELTRSVATDCPADFYVFKDEVAQQTHSTLGLGIFSLMK